MTDAVVIDGGSLGFAGLIAVARDGVEATLCPEAERRMAASLRWVRDAAAGTLRDAAGDPLAVYGVNTGYGSLARMRIDGDQIRALSWNLVRSHAAGVGPPCAPEVVRAMMVLRANALAKGVSGCRPALVHTLLAMLRRGVVPVVPSQGSCGSSGDLAPLSHLGLVLFRGPDGQDEPSGQAWFQGTLLAGAEAMRRAGIARLVPGPKEGLAITNGAQLTTALAGLACVDAARLVHAAEVAAAMSWEAVRGVTRALHPSVHAMRPYPGAIASAGALRALLSGSTLIDSMAEKVQDAYSIRCTPQILGAVRDGVRFAAEQIAVELNAATDNPLILLDGEGDNKAFSAGMFHGEPVGMAADHLKLAVSELAALSERRIYRLTTGSLSSRLPPLLVHRDRPGLGLMVPQTTAASLVAANRALCWPASADSIPTCEDQEDVVAMSTTAARRARRIVTHSQQVVAIELLTAASALAHRRAEDPSLTFGQGTQTALREISLVLSEAGELPGDEIAALAQAVAEGRIVDAVESELGPLPEVL
ncbi:MAG: histidine ammonia-lyase [Deltaproteobacteria bacterium]|nr:MAG: histidine ammonia-lyase [Deltaproteobacteria bacterium]